MFKKIGSGILLIVMLLTFAGAAFAQTNYVSAGQDNTYRYRYMVTTNYAGATGFYSSSSTVYSNTNDTNGIVNMSYSTPGNPSVSVSLGNRVNRGWLNNFPSAGELTGPSTPYSISVNVVPGKTMKVIKNATCKRWRWNHTTVRQRQPLKGGAWQTVSSVSSTSSVTLSIANSFSYSIN